MATKVITLDNLTQFKGKQDTFNNNKFINKTSIGVEVASLQAGKIPLSQIPATAITDTFVVNSEAEMLALNAQKGDVAIRLDSNKNFILKQDGASTLANWQQLVVTTNIQGVTSINGLTGDVTINDATTSKSGLMGSSDKTKLDGLSNYSLPTASATTLGGVKVGANLSINSGVLSAAAYTHPATQSANGLMSKEDKLKLDTMVSAGDLEYASNADIDSLF